MVLVASCAPGAREGEPFEGVWRSEGYGSHLVVEDGLVAAFETTSVSCVFVFEGTTRGIGEAAEIVDDRLTITDAGQVVRYDPVDALPDGCVEAAPTADRVFVIEVAAATISEQHARLAARDPQWDQRARETVQRARVAQNDGDVLALLEDLLTGLDDPQTRLITPEGTVASRNPPDVVAPLLSAMASRGEASAEGAVVSGVLPGGAGYLAITRFEDLADNLERSEVTLATALDEALADLAATPGLVLDLRANGGGVDALAMLVASRFVLEEATVVERVARVDGTDRFVKAAGSLVRPIPASTYTGPVVVLVGPGTVGAAEILVIALEDLDRVTLVGERTAGSMSPILARTLPNGWVLGVPNQRVVDASGIERDVTPIEPDVVVGTTTADLAVGSDPGLEAAVTLLGG